MGFSAKQSSLITLQNESKNKNLVVPDIRLISLDRITFAVKWKPHWITWYVTLCAILTCSAILATFGDSFLNSTFDICSQKEASLDNMVHHIIVFLTCPAIWTTFGDTFLDSTFDIYSQMIASLVNMVRHWIIWYMVTLWAILTCLATWTTFGDTFLNSTFAQQITFCTVSSNK